MEYIATRLVGDLMVVVGVTFGVNLLKCFKDKITGVVEEGDDQQC